MTVNPLRAQQVEFTIPYYREAERCSFKADSPYTGTADITGHGAKDRHPGKPDAVNWSTPACPMPKCQYLRLALPTRSWRSIPAASMPRPSTFRRRNT